MAKATGAPVYCPKLEVPVLADIMAWVPWPGIGPFESYDADETLEGGERLELAGLEIDVLFTPGHSPGHVTYSIPAEHAIFSGDVLFQGSIGRTDLPGGDHAAAAHRSASCSTRSRTRPTCSPATWHRPRSARERATNPFLHELVGVTDRIQAPRGTFDVLGDDALARDALVETARRVLEPRRLRAHRDARVRGHASCSRAAWGSPPTSCRRRCTRSTPASRSR